MLGFKVGRAPLRMGRSHLVASNRAGVNDSMSSPKLVDLPGGTSCSASRIWRHRCRKGRGDQIWLLQL